MQKLKAQFNNSLKLPGSHKKLLIVCLFTISVLGFAGWMAISNLQDGRKVYAEAAGHKIYEDEVRDLIGENGGISDYDAAKVLADKYLTEALGEESGISVSDEEIAEEFGADVNKQKTINKYHYQNQRNQIYFAKLQDNNQGIYKGKYLVTHFSRYLPYESPLLEDSKKLEPKIGDTAAIAKDRLYAERLITRLYNDIESGKITFDEAIKIERDDPIVGEKTYTTLSHSGSFDTREDAYTFMGSELVRKQIKDLKPGEMSKPTPIQVVDSIEGKSSAESYFLVVQMDEAVGGSSGVDFEQYLDEAKKRMEYEIYV